MIDLTIWYTWLYFLIPFAILIAADEWESFWLGGIGLVFAGAILWFASVNPITWIIQNPIQFGGYLLLYFCIGAVYAIAKWKYSFLPNNSERTKRDFDLFRLNWVTTQSVENRGKTPPLDEFKKSSYHTMTASAHKSRIMGWMVWWVPSMFWTVTHDFFKAVWEHIYKVFSNLFEKISSDHVDKTLS